MPSRGKGRDRRGTRVFLIGIMALGLLAGTIPIVVSASSVPSLPLDNRHVQAVSEGFAPAPSKSIAVTSVQNFTPDLVLSPLFYGVNVRTDDPFNQSDADALASADALTWRFPGGQIGESYNYTTNTRNTTGAFEPNSISNFVALCESVHCHAILQLPAEINDTATDAYYVEFVEHTLHFTPAIWEFGNEPALWTNFNEPWINWTTTPGTNATPSTYAAIVPSIISAIRSVDLTTPIDPLGGSGGGNAGDAAWIYDVMAAAQTTAQYISIHSYIGETTNVTNASAFYSPLYESPYALNASIPRLYATILAACATCTDVGLLVSEAGASTEGRNVNFETSFSMDMWDAVEVIQAADVGLTSIDFFAFDNGYPGSWILAPGATFDPAYYLFKDLTPLLGSTVLNVTLNSTDQGMLQVGAWWGGEDNWSMLLVNLDTENATTVNLTYSGFPVHGNIDNYLWNGSTTQPAGEVLSWLNVTTVEPDSMELITVNFSLPSGPTDLSISGSSPNSISLSWTPPGGLESGATVYLANYSYGACKPFSTAFSAGPVATYTVQDLSPTDEYCFQVTEWNGVGQGVPSATVQATTLPLAPGTIAAAASSPTSIEVSWSNPPGTLTDDLVFSELGTACTAASRTDLGEVNQSFDAMGQAAATQYCFYVEAADNGGVSSPSPIAVATTPPVAPLDLSALSMNSTTATLSWTKPAGTIVNETVYWGTSCSALSSEQSVGLASIYTVNGLAPATSYCFAISAWSAGGQGAISSGVSGTTLPAAPLDLLVMSTGTNTATLSWTKPAGTIVNETVYWGTSCSALSSEQSVGLASIYTVNGLAPATSYCFSVSTWSAGGQGTLSSSASQTTLPLAPSRLSATTLSDSTVYLSWTDPDESLVGVELSWEAGTSCSSATPELLAPGVEAANVTGLSGATGYCFYVNVVDLGGSSTPSPIVTATTLPEAPSGVTVTTTETTATLGWTVPSGAVVNETVYWGTICGTYTDSASVGPAQTTYTITALVPGTSYCFTVTAWSAGGQSPPASGVSGTTLSVPPINSTAPPTAWLVWIVAGTVVAVAVAVVAAILLVRRRRKSMAVPSQSRPPPTSPPETD